MKAGRKSGLKGEEGPSGLELGEETGRKRRSSGSRRQGSKRGYLDGQMLIAMPTMGDERFARSLIYVCAHSSENSTWSAPPT
jgi:putative transcriptional regulator